MAFWGLRARLEIQAAGHDDLAGLRVSRKARAMRSQAREDSMVDSKSLASTLQKDEEPMRLFGR
jgi:hypothetical protein